ncbi:MAG: hypothetical protein K6T30_06505 [Alicyclobacillus sp.]|nr:hypothetical protein [Alicyclobacillus sp.]
MLSRTPGRRPRAHLSAFSTTQIHLQNPFLVSFWSLVTPGLGNLAQDRLAKGLILVIWGLVVNTAAHINVALLYSLTGHFDLAKDALNTRWFLLYVAVYVFTAWSAYRGTVDQNQLYLLADREDAPLPVFTIQVLDINYLDKRNPWLAAAWSALGPGLGMFYLHRVTEGFFFVAWTILVAYQSNFFPALQLTLTGDFPHATAVLNPEWFLYLPSIYAFQVYHAYTCAVEGNKLFEKAQSQFLRDTYQAPSFPMPPGVRELSKPCM